MSDKILTEAFDKLKAIEESDDPFCIGAKAETEVVEAYTEFGEADVDSEQTSSPEERQPPARAESFTVDSESGDSYMIDFQNDGGQKRAFIDINGITVATYTDTMSGATQAQIKDDAQILDALAALLMQFGQND